MSRCAAVALLVLTPFYATAQIAATNPPEFEAASIKPCPPGTEYGGMRGGPGTASPGQINYEATTLRAVVARAFGVQRFQIVGPPWFDDQRFDVVARIPPGTTMPRFQLMLQKLLADRFHLEFHREDRPSSVYELTVAKSGLKATPAPAPETPRLPNADASPTTSIRWSTAKDKIEVHGHGASIRQLLIWLNEETGRDIVDKTGLTGAYDFEMSWTQVATTEPNDPILADLIDAAIEKYMGLKVIRRKVPVETLVIDRLDRTPVEN